MTTIVARPLGSRVQALELACSCAAALPFVALAATRPAERVWLALGLSLAAATRTVVHDFERHVVPRVDVVSVAAVPLGSAFFELSGGAFDTAADVLLGALVMSGPVCVLHTAVPGWFGFGDVTLAAALGLTLGLVDPWAGMPALLIAAFAALVRAWERRTRAVPFAPSLLAGAVVAAWASAFTTGSA